MTTTRKAARRIRSDLAIAGVDSVEIKVTIRPDQGFRESGV
jgi:hypothetical protein